MQAMDDRTLLQEYATTGSETAFEKLVSRHVRLIYSAALRQVHDAHLAEEVTQAVFIILAQKAKRLGDQTILSGWLFKTTRFVALAHLRAAARRRRYEQESHMQAEAQFNPPDLVWEEMSPLLDEALVHLGDQDRQAVVLRFFEGRSLPEVGHLLGVAEDAARMRINRALEKLRRFFGKRGIKATGAAIAGAISVNSVHAAPPALAKTITAVAVMKGAAAGGSTLALVKGALTLMAWTKARTTLVVGACVLLAAGTTATINICERPRPVHGIPPDWASLGGPGQWYWADNKINASSTSGDSILASRKIYRDVTLSAVLYTTNREASLALRVRNGNNSYIIQFVPNETPWAGANGGRIAIARRRSGRETILSAYRGPGLPFAGEPVKLTATVKGPWIGVYLNGVLLLQTTDRTFPAGRIGLRIFGDPDQPCDATFSNVTFY